VGTLGKGRENKEVEIGFHCIDRLSGRVVGKPVRVDFCEQESFLGRVIFYIVEVYAVEISVFVGVFASFFAWWTLDDSNKAIANMWACGLFFAVAGDLHNLHCVDPARIQKMDSNGVEFYFPHSVLRVGLRRVRREIELIGFGERDSRDFGHRFGRVQRLKAEQGMTPQKGDCRPALKQRKPSQCARPSEASQKRAGARLPAARHIGGLLERLFRDVGDHKLDGVRQGRRPRRRIEAFVHVFDAVDALVVKGAASRALRTQFGADFKQ